MPQRYWSPGIGNAAGRKMRFWVYREGIERGQALGSKQPKFLPEAKGAGGGCKKNKTTGVGRPKKDRDLLVED